MEWNLKGQKSEDAQMQHSQILQGHRPKGFDKSDILDIL